LIYFVFNSYRYFFERGLGNVMPEARVGYKQREPKDENLLKDKIIDNGDGSITRFSYVKPKNNNLTSRTTEDLGNFQSHPVMKQWNYDEIAIENQTSGVCQGADYRIDLQGTHPNGPDGTPVNGVKKWANLQLQLGGAETGRRSAVEKAEEMRRQGKSTSLAEVHAPLNTKFPPKVFRRAFSESMDTGYQVWMKREEKKPKDYTGR